MKRSSSFNTVVILILVGLCAAAFSQQDGFVPLLKADSKGIYSKHGWNHYGPGHFTLDEKTGVLQGHGGMGLLWYSVKKFKDFVLELEYSVELPKSNSGVFVRIPELVYDNSYVGKSFEIQICGTCIGIHKSAGVYDAVAPKEGVEQKGPGEWNLLRITCQGERMKIELNNQQTVDWKITVPVGKIKETFSEGYIGLQNHDKDNSTFFRNIRIKEL